MVVLQEGYYWVKYRQELLEIVYYTGSFWYDFDNSILDEDFIVVVQYIEEPKNGKE
jgi:hypothetical protein